jgi:hypothetical protein
MQRVQALRPVATRAVPSVELTGTDNKTSTVLYTLQTLDEELVIMTLLRAVPETYQQLHSSLLIQTTLTLETVKQAFHAEDEHRKHHKGSQTTAAALRAFTSNRNRSFTPAPQQNLSPSPSLSPSRTTANANRLRRGPCYFC